MRRIVAKIIGGCALLSLAAAPASGQNRTPVDRRVQDQRYAIGVVERVLEQAVEHGASRTRNRLQAVLPPADMLLAAEARVRGFRQEGYGVFFDVEVPDLDTSLPWSFSILDQSGLGLNSALQQLRSFVDKTGDTNVAQALKRIELEVVPASANLQNVNLSTPSPELAIPGPVAGSAAATAAADPPPAPPADPILNNVAEAYRAEIREALTDAMLQYSRGLELGPAEWLHVAAKRNDARSRLTPVNTDDATMHIRVRGADLSAYLGGQITRDEALKRIEVKLF